VESADHGDRAWGSVKNQSIVSQVLVSGHAPFLQHLHELHNNSSEYLKSFLYEEAEEAPRWDNFNEHQVEQHTKQLEEVF
jgi:hypothetical protein